MSDKRQEAPGALEQVRAFVNTADFEAGREELASATALRSWLAARGLAPRGTRLSSDDLEHALELREAIRAALLANSDGDPAPEGACRTIDEAAQRAMLRPRLHPDGTSVLEPAASGVDAALGRLVAAVHLAAAEGTWTRLKACRDPDCRWAFFDHTKNRAGSWCSMGVCGNRAKARAYRARRRRADS